MIRRRLLTAAASSMLAIAGTLGASPAPPAHACSWGDCGSATSPTSGSGAHYPPVEYPLSRADVIRMHDTMQTTGSVCTWGGIASMNAMTAAAAAACSAGAASQSETINAAYYAGTGAVCLYYESKVTQAFSYTRCRPR